MRKARRKAGTKHSPERAPHNAFPISGKSTPRPTTRTGSTDDQHVRYPLVSDAQALLYMANQGTLTFHPRLSRINTPDHPDFVLFDLDPGQATFADVVRIAQRLHQALDAEGLGNFVKTSGKTGLHVLVPWRRPNGYDEARAWALSVARRVAKDLTGIATVERSKSARGGKAYIDVMQNARGHHVVPPYVLRAVPPATVSTPLDWDELTSRLKPEHFHLEAALKRSAATGGGSLAGWQ